MPSAPDVTAIDGVNAVGAAGVGDAVFSLRSFESGARSLWMGRFEPWIRCPELKNHVLRAPLPGDLTPEGAIRIDEVMEDEATTSDFVLSGCGSSDALLEPSVHVGSG